MGQSLTWVAVRGRSEDEVHRLLGLKRAGGTGEWGAPGIVGRQMDGGWYVLVAGRCEDPIAGSKALRALSAGCEALACSLEEHVMFSSCVFWKNGRKRWSVAHRGDVDALDLATSGKLPAEYAGLKEECLEKQAAEGGANAETDHVIELPMAMAERLAGFSIGRDAAAVPDERWERLHPGRLQRMARALSAWLGWLILAGILIAAAALSAGVALGLRRLLDRLSPYVPRLIS